MVNEQLLKQLKISIGDIGISVTANNKFKIDNTYSLFLSQNHQEVIHYKQDTYQYILCFF